MDGLSMNETPTEAEAQDTGEEDLKGLKSDEELVERAKECYRAGFDASAKWRDDALEDLNFLAGEQWDPAVKGGRDAAGRPALTVNRLPQFVRQVTNEQRQSKPAVTVSPVDDGSDKKTAEVLQGIIRNVEYTSNADAAYAAGGQSAAVTGLGYWDVGAEYEDEKSFDQRLVIRRIGNPLSVVMDPGAKEMAGDDARWCVISTDISVGEWEANFPDKEMPTSKGWDGRGDSAASWVGKEGVRIHEYRYITEEPDTLLEVPEPILRVPPGMFMDMPHGGVALASELEPQVAQLLAQSGGDATPEGAQNGGAVLASELEPDVAKLLKSRRDINQRPTLRRTARWAKIAGDEVIEKGVLAGRYLQLVRVVGTELEIDGETIYEGIVRHAKDTQRMFNYFVSAEAEAIALTPKAPFIGTAKQFEGLEDIWRTANSHTHSYLPYNPVPDAPPPQRVMAEANVSAITNARMQAADDLKAVTGIYDAALGARSNEQSGRAILARQSQGQTANFHFQDNLAMAVRYTGRILIDLIPKIYSGPKTLRILGEDGSHEMVPVNQPGQYKGEDVHIALDAGRYDVAVSMGPSYQSRRQEASATLLELVKTNPAMNQVAGDLLVASMDIPNGEAIAERLRKMLPPEIRPPDDKQPPPQVLAQQLQQMAQQNQQLVAALHQAHDMLDTQTVANESKERIELIKVHADLMKTAATLESKEHVAMLAKEAGLISKRLGMPDLQPQLPEPPQAPQPPPQPMPSAMNGVPNAPAG
jgi:hypothetical protein